MELLIRLNPVALSLVIPALISGSIAIYAFSRRPVVGSRVFAFLMLDLCVWSIFYGVELSCLSLEGMMFSAVMEYLGIATVPVLWLILTLLYTGRGKLVTRRNIILLFIIPAVTIVMVATNQLHHFYYSSASVDTSGSFPMLALTRGPWFWVHSAYSYAVLLTITFLLIERMGKPGTVFRYQVIALLVGMSVPWTVNILYVVFGMVPFGHLDLTPFAFTVTGVVVAWSMFRHGLFDIMPTAYDTILDSIDDVIVVLDTQSRIVEYNKAAGEILELSQAEIGKSADTVWKVRPDLIDLGRLGEAVHIEIVIGRHDSKRYYEASTYNVADRHNHALRKVISLHDITDRKQAEKALRVSEEKYRLLVETAGEVILVVQDFKIKFFNRRAVDLTGYTVDELNDMPFANLIYPDDLAMLASQHQRRLQGESFESVYPFRYVAKDGRIGWAEISAALIDWEGRPATLSFLSDITERKQMEQKLEEMATHDFLTGLPNRVLLLDRFTIAAALAHRNKARLAVMSLDLDKFKLINDIYGHGAGDQVLKAVGTRIMGIIRASDTLARIGGDEFVLVMMETDQMKDATAIAQKILDSFKEPLLIDGNDLLVSTSIGIAIYPEDGQDLESLTKKSDAAMYYSKGHGRDQFKFFGDGDVQIS
jgi:diguanylate cyclase (GGDEF)-like protein/PAS domain S-box-containing protein